MACIGWSLNAPLVIFLLRQEAARVMQDGKPRVPVVELLRRARATDFTLTNAENSEASITRNCLGNDVITTLYSFCCLSNRCYLAYVHLQQCIPSSLSRWFSKGPGMEIWIGVCGRSFPCDEPHWSADTGLCTEGSRSKQYLGNSWHSSSLSYHMGRYH